MIPAALPAAKSSSTGSSSGPWLPGPSPAHRTGDAAAVPVPVQRTIDPVFEGEIKTLGGYRSIMGAQVVSGILATLGVPMKR